MRSGDDDRTPARQSAAPGQVGIKVFLHQAVEYSEHQQACSI